MPLFLILESLWRAPVVVTEMYIIFGMRAMVRSDDLYPADPSRATKSPDGKLGFNTAVIIDSWYLVQGTFLPPNGFTSNITG